MADDLTHGLGASRLELNRRWSGSDTLNTHFGVGWADQNLMQLTLVSRSVVLIWRGGTGWQTANRKSGKAFEGDDGVKIEQTDKGWIAQMPHRLTLTFDTNGRLISKKPAAGPACNYSYDKTGRLISIATASDNEIKYRYDKRGRVTSADGPEGLRLDYTYDDKGRLVTVENSRRVRIEYRYGDDGRLTAAKDQFGNEFELAKIGPVKRPVARATGNLNQLSQSPKYGFDAQGRVTSTKEGAASKSYEYDEAGRTSAITGPEGRGSCKYDAFGRITSVQNPDGTSSRFEYNNLDLPTLISKPDGENEKLKYDEHGRLLRRERSPTDWEELSYDSAGRIEMRRHPPRAEERYFYDETDRVVKIKYSNGREVSYDYDPSGRMLTESWSSGEKRAWRYDANGRVAESIDPAGLRTTYLYDKEGRLSAIADDVHGRTVLQHSARGKTIETPAFGKSIYETTPWGEPLSIIQANRQTTFRYDPRGWLQAILPPSRLMWKYEHDAAGRLMSVTSPGGLKTMLSRDAAGRLTSVVRGPVVWRQYHYDAAGRVGEEFSVAGNAARYKYDADGRVSEVALPGETALYLRDKNGWQSSIRSPNYQIEEHYDGEGSLDRRRYEPAKLDLKLPRDSQGRPAGIELNEIKITYVYDGRGQIAQISLPNGAAVKVSRDEAGRAKGVDLGSAATLKISYDQADRIAALEAKHTSGKAIFDERYSYDAIGNLTALATDSNPPQTLQYDRDDRLINVGGGNKALGFQYDLDGNLLAVKTANQTQLWTLDKMGRPTQQGSTTFSWDAAGNLTRSENSRTKMQNEFDAADRLVRQTDGKSSWTFGYLPDGDRLWKQGPVGKTYFAYLQDRLAGFRDERGVSWLLVYLPGSDRPIALCGSDGTTLFILADRLASARRFLDSNGAVVASVDYGPFGNIEASAGKPPLGLFAGTVRDESGLFYARRRYYDPQAARFISIDPVISGYTPASQNAYAYAGNNPYRYRDPMGTVFYELWDYARNLQEEFGPGGAREQRGLNPSVSHASFTPEEMQKLNNLKDQYEQAERIIQGGPDVSAALKQKALEDQARLSEQLRKTAQSVDDRIDAAIRTPLESSGGATEGAAESAINRGTFQKGGNTQALAGRAEQAAGKGTQLISKPSVGEAAESSSLPANEAAQAKAATAAGGKAEEAAKAAAKENALVPKSGTATGQGAGEDAAGPHVTSDFDDSARYEGKPGINKDGSIPKDGVGNAGKPKPPGDIEIVYDAEKGVWKPAARGAAEGVAGAGEAAGERWLGPKILEGGGKLLRPLGPLLKGIEILQTIETAGTMAKNFTDNLNQPFAEAQKEKQGARWAGERFANELRKLASADPDAVIMGDGHKFDPNNPKDVDELMLGLSQNLFFGRKPFDGLLKKITNKSTEFMGPAEGDTAASTTLDSAWQLMRTGLAAEKAANEAAKECIQQQTEAQSQLQSAMTIAGARAVAEGDVSTAPETANDVKNQTVAVEAQSKSLQAAFEEMTAAVGKCDDAATKICDYAQQAASATEEQIKTWQADATTELFGASNILNAAQAKIDATDGSLDKLRTSTAQLEGFRTSLWLYKGASQVGEAADATAGGALAAAKAAAQKATAARAKLGPLQEQIRAIPPQISKLLAPYVASDIEAAALDASGQGLGKDIADPGLFDFSTLLTMASPVIDAALANQKAVEKAIGKVDIDGIVNAAHDAITAAENMRSGASALASGPDRYRPLQTASQCFALIKFAGEKTAEASPTPDENAAGTPSSATAAEKVIVPDMSGFEGIPQMRAVGSHAGLVVKFAGVKPDSKEQEFKYAGQFPRAGSEASKGDVLVVSFYQKFEDASATPAEEAAASPAAGNKIIVPDMSGFEGIPQMRAVGSHAGLVVKFAGVKPDKKEQEFKYAGQFPRAGSEANKGDVLVVSFYQKFEDATAQGEATPIAVAAISPTPVDLQNAETPTPSPAGSAVASSTAPPLGPAKTGTMPNLIGLTLDQATTRLSKNMNIGGDEIGTKPPSPEKALTIYLQTPAAGSKVDTEKKVNVTVKRYGSAKTDDGSGTSTGSTDNPLGGVWKGEYAHWSGNATNAEGRSAGEWMFSMRKRKSGGFDYFLNQQPLDEVQVQSGKVTAKEATDTWVGGQPEILRETHTVTIEPIAGGKVRLTMTDHTIMRAGGEKKAQILLMEMAPDTRDGIEGFMSMMPDEMIPSILADARKKNKEHEEANARSH